MHVCTSELAVYEAGKNQDANANYCAAYNHLDETIKRLFLNGNVHFTVLVFCHGSCPLICYACFS